MRVDFYVLSEPGEAARLQFACRLVEKAYRLDNAVHIAIDDDRLAGEFDELLWTFRDGSFVPHERLNHSSGNLDSPVTIGALGVSTRNTDLLVNLNKELPDSCSGYARIAEVLSADPECRSDGRRRYARYAELGHTLETHKL